MNTFYFYFLMVEKKECLKKVKNLVVGHTAEMGKNKAGTLSLTLKKHPCYSLSILPFAAEVFTESLTLCEPIF